MRFAIFAFEIFLILWVLFLTIASFFLPIETITIVHAIVLAIWMHLVRTSLERTLS
jgi:hypothetical protein